MNKYQKIIFGVSFALILVIICVSIVVYWMTFGGNLSTDSNDWIVFATLVGSIGTMLFTGLNVLVFYMLTSTIAKHNEIHWKYEQQVQLVNQFNRVINSVFSLDPDGNPSCDVNATLLTRVIDWLQKVQRKQTILPTFGSDNYKAFINDFKDFCLAYKESESYGDPRMAFSGIYPEEEAYKLYRKANDLIFKMFDDMVDIPS
mgnify:FL=1